MKCDLDIYEYENLLLGNSERNSHYFEGRTLLERQQIVGRIWNYAITRLLHLTPQEALLYVNDEVVHIMKLDRYIQYLDINPDKFYMGKDYRFVLQYAFPNDIKYDLKEETISDYERCVKQGSWSNDKTEFRFPKNFFTAEDGIKRAHILLNYVVNKYLSDLSIVEQYEFFADKKKAAAWLKDKGLGGALIKVYRDPLDYFYNAMPSNKQSQFLYYSNILKTKVCRDVRDFSGILKNLG